MRKTPLVAALLVCATVCIVHVSSAQDRVRLTILSVTIGAAGDQLTINGSGFGSAPAVTIDGQPVTVLPGATDTLVTVLAPAVLLTTPGTYRLTMVDPVRQVGEAFVVVSAPGLVPAVGLMTSGTGAAPGAAEAGLKEEVAATGGAPTTFGAGGGGRVGTSADIEDPGSPYRTAFGFQALGANTSGLHNTATGYQALDANDTGSYNTANGSGALFSNTLGKENTAVGYGTLHANTVGGDNTAVGHSALYANSGGSNTATGAFALDGNTSGDRNTAVGVSALTYNSTGSYNSATGYHALRANTQGLYNTATGFETMGGVPWPGHTFGTGSYNTATGTSALQINGSGSFNTASGSFALASNTAGSYNTAVGHEALYSHQDYCGEPTVCPATTGSLNAALGYAAGSTARRGSYNVFLGASVVGETSDMNTMRLGLPYDGTNGQNRTFIAGIRGTTVTGGFPVVIDANGQLGSSLKLTLDTGGAVGIGTSNPETGLHILNAGVAQARMRTDSGGGIYSEFGSDSAAAHFGAGIFVGTTQQAHFYGGGLSLGQYVTTDPPANGLIVSGAIGVGTSNPETELHVFNGSTAQARLRTDSGGGIYSEFGSDSAAAHFGAGIFVGATQQAHFYGGGLSLGEYVATDPPSNGLIVSGDVGIGTTTPANPLQMGSGAYVSAGGVWTNASSRTLKDQIADLPADRAWEAFARLRPVTFVYKVDPKEAHVGFIAEDVPDLVATADRRSLAAMDIVAVLTKVVQEQQAMIADLQARLARVEESRR